MKNKIQSEAGAVKCIHSSTALAPQLVLPRAAVLSLQCFRRYSAALCSLMAGVTALVGTHGAAAEPDYNAPWQDSSKKGSAPNKQDSSAQAQPVVASQAQSSAAANDAAGSAGAATADSMLDKKITLRKPAKNEISASANFFFGSGTVTVPLGYSLDPKQGSSVHQVGTAQRSSDYIGGTLSYSFGQAWYLDLSYDQGKLATAKDFNTFSVPGQKQLQSSFNIDDNWYQVYLRYTFPKLRGKPFSAYMRAGFTYVDSALKAEGVNFDYHQDDKTADYYGNLGFGVAYNLYNGRRFRLYLQGEAEVFYGTRSQNTTESTSGTIGITPQEVSLSNTLYGGNGRATLRMEYRLGSSGLFKIFADGGVQGKFTQISYPDVGSSTSSASSEYLWGPYIRIGAKYAF